MGKPLRLSAISAFVLVAHVLLQATGGSASLTSELRSRVNDPVPVAADSAAGIRVEHIRFEDPPDDAPQPSSVLKFAVINAGHESVSDLVISISIRETMDDEDRLPRSPVGPFTISGHATIEAGYSIEYALVLRNLDADCRCQADVKVISTRAVPPAP